MRRMTTRVAGAAALLAAVVLGGYFAGTAIGGGQAPTAAAGAGGAAAGAVHFKVNVQRFQYVARQKRLVAHGQVVATYRVNGHVEGSTTKAVVMRAQQGTTCRVLHLELGELHLALLGLIVNLVPAQDPSIVLDISADSSEALGKLLCQVINSVQGGTGTTAKTTKATHRLNGLVRKQYSGGVASFDAPLSVHSGVATTTGTTGTTTTTAPTAPTGQCPVLDLVLGPLNLDLLGLIVTLNQIDLNISANPVGTLGSLFCQLAGSTTGTTTTTASTGTATTGTTTTGP